MKYYEKKFSSSPDELCVESTPSLAFSSLPWPFHHPILMNQVCQPVSTAITQHITVQEDQLALRPVEPVVVGICNGYSTLKSWWDSENTERITSVVAVHSGVMHEILMSWLMLKFIVLKMHNEIILSNMWILSKFLHTATAQCKIFGLWSWMCDKSTPACMNLSPLCCDPARSQTKRKLFTQFCCL